MIFIDTYFHCLISIWLFISFIILLGDDKSNEAFVNRKRKSLEEANRAKDTCPIYFDESVIVADSCILYKRGIIELQLSVFINDHESSFDGNDFIVVMIPWPRSSMQQCIPGALVQTTQSRF